LQNVQLDRYTLSVGLVLLSVYNREVENAVMVKK